MKLIELGRGRAKTLLELVATLLPFVHQPDHQQIDAKVLSTEAVSVLQHFMTLVETCDQWESGTLQTLIEQTLTDLEIKMKQLGIPLRLALFAQTSSPNLPDSIVWLGQTETLKRIARYIEFVNAN